MVAYQTAYLRKHYPVEFMAAMLTSVMGSNEKVAFYINACRKMNIDVLPPDINESYVDFSVVGEKIRFGIAAIKNVGKGAIQAVIEAREKKGNFTGFTDFCEKVNLSDVNKRAIESMIKSGCFDSLLLKRAQLLNVYEKVSDSVVNNRKRNIDGQMSLFSMGSQIELSKKDDFPDIKEFDKKYLLTMEKEMMGLYISGHPLDEYQDEVDIYTNIRISEIININHEEDSSLEYKVEDGQRVVIGGIISSVNIKSTRKNEIMAFIKVEDVITGIEVIVFPKVYQGSTSLLHEDTIVLIKGRISIREDEQPKIIAESIEPMRKLESRDLSLYLRLNEATWRRDIEDITPILNEHSGKSQVYIVLSGSRKKLGTPEKLWVNVTNELIDKLKSKIGFDNVRVG